MVGQVSNSLKTRDNIVAVDTEPGTTADSKISACLAALPNGGVCDARGLAATTQLITSTVVIAGTAHVITLLCDPSTVFIPNSTITNLFNVGQHARVTGCTISLPPGYTGDVFTFNSAQATIYGWFDTEVDHIHITGASGATTGTGFLLSSSGPNQVVSFLRLHDIQVAEVGAAIQLAAIGSGAYVNGNSFANFITVNCPIVVDFNPGGGEVKPTIQGNLFINFIVEGSNRPGYTYWRYNGAGNIWSNISEGTIGWDLPAGPDITNNTGLGNVAGNEIEGFVGQSGTGWTPNYNNVYKSSDFGGHVPGLVSNVLFWGRSANSSLQGGMLSNVPPSTLTTFPYPANGYNIDPATGNTQIYCDSAQDSAIQIFDKNKNVIRSSVGCGNGIWTSNGENVNGNTASRTLNLSGTSTVSSFRFVSTGIIFPSSVAANSCSDQSFTDKHLADLKMADNLGSISPPSTLGNLSVSGFVSKDGMLTLHFCNSSPLAAAPPSGIYKFFAVH